MPIIKSIEARLPVADVARSAAFFAATLGFAVGTIWPERAPAFAILLRDRLRLQLGKQAETVSGRYASSALWLDVEDLAGLHSRVKEHATIEWEPEVYSYGRREFGFRDPDGNLVILSEVTSDPPTCDQARGLDAEPNDPSKPTGEH